MNKIISPKNEGGGGYLSLIFGTIQSVLLGEKKREERGEVKSYFGKGGGGFYLIKRRRGDLIN